MTYEMYRYIFIGSAIAAVVMLGLAILLYFKLRIPKVLGDLTGSTRRRAVKVKEEHGIDADSSNTSVVATAKITQSGNLIPGSVSKPKKTVGKTEKLRTDEIAKSGPRAVTTLLPADPHCSPPVKATTILADNGVSPLKATTVLANQSSQNQSIQSEETFNAFEVEYDITFIHTSEIIA